MPDKRGQMKLWRLTRPEYVALDGAGAAKSGGRYSSPGIPLVNFASEPGLAVLVALRYVQATPAFSDDDFVLGWTTIDCDVERVPHALGSEAKVAFVDAWAKQRRSLAIAVQSAVLPEADIILMNPLHADAADIAPLSTRPFRFSECLHRPPMLERYTAG
ncbi:RES family NAD+ phosphorylase [Sphingomonas sp. 1185]|uniref:RES family NAD+ phosphorylase n=1 Tax=Sphingomonas sp. 1185 TaxID=3156411 RepID=UPI003398C58B